MSSLARRQTAGLVEAGMVLSSELDLGALLQRIADLAREVVGARYAAVGEVGDDGLLVRFVYSGIDEPTAQKIGDPPQGRGLLGLITDEGRPIRVREIAEHPRSHGFPANHPEMRSFLGVPVAVKGHVFGRLYLTDKEGSAEFSKDDERIAMTLASQAGVALDNARLLEEVKARGDELAILEERDRISKDLHDGVIQSIYSVGLSLRGVMDLVEGDPNALQTRIDEAITELDNVVRDVRSYIFALQPQAVEERGLMAAIQELAKDLEVNTLAEVTTSLDERACDVVAASGRADVTHIVREVLSNVARHARATMVDVSCSMREGTVVLAIEDDGVGFDPAVVTRGHGLANIRDRARRLGGRLEILPRTPRGTRHVVYLPAVQG